MWPNSHSTYYTDTDSSQVSSLYHHISFYFMSSRHNKLRYKTKDGSQNHLLCLQRCHIYFCYELSFCLKNILCRRFSFQSLTLPATQMQIAAKPLRLHMSYVELFLFTECFVPHVLCYGQNVALPSAQIQIALMKVHSCVIRTLTFCFELCFCLQNVLCLMFCVSLYLPHRYR